MTHIMTDIETLGTRPGAVIMSVAFVRFSDLASVSVNLNIHDQLALGLHIDPSTEQFWQEQNAKDPALTAWNAATVNPVPLAQALPYLANWLAWAAPNNDALIWCHGATFDCPLLGELYRLAGIATPWNYWAVRDTRTLYDLAGINVKDYAVPPPHIALNDALAQTNAAKDALAILARAHTQQVGQAA